MIKVFPKIAALVFLLLAAISLARAVDVRGQIFFPDGSVPREPIRFFLSSDDGRVNEYRFTDSNGRFILERLSGLVSYTITVESDGATYDKTTFSFIPSYDSTPRLTLQPLARKIVTGPPTVSAASGYKPAPKAAELHEAALKEVQKQKYDAAEKLLRLAIAKDPKFPAPLIDLGALLMQTGRYPEAEKTLRQALEADSKSTLALMNLGITLNRLRQYQAAVVPLREALRLQPGLIAAEIHLGIALLEIDQFDEAEKMLTRAAKAGGPDEALAQLFLGKLYAQTGDFVKGVAALEAYLAKAPNTSNVAEVLGLIERMKKERTARK
ncbi:MAG: tetratricopeptide repeat protein [Acidobacteria bacterium]|nr:tetratricopeptide repeat protein [Acidobacteriota bacterium]